MLNLIGDINFTDGFFDTGFGVGTSLLNGGNPFYKINHLQSDYWIGNFECVASTVSNKKGIYSKQFNILPNVIRTYKSYEFVLCCK